MAFNAELKLRHFPPYQKIKNGGTREERCSPPSSAVVSYVQVFDLVPECNATMRVLEFPDRPYVEHIRAQLWNGRPFGRAAVMIGAGFSRNAESVTPSAGPFPLWNELAYALFDGLYPPDTGITRPEQRARAERASANGGVMRIAQEYEVAFGRSALVQAVHDAVPDASYRPSDVHRLLLSLPWADVFTTNYDTLLERTLPDVLNRRYEVVLTGSDLPARAQPRIFKLHGSMPDGTRYVLTEEDYRVYPAVNAPFVNSVQQALMENVFVLLGFSGTDPNFLQWLGWVRDRLQHAVHPVYLCGLLDLSPQRRQLLRSLNVVTVDLSPLFPPDPGREDARHRRALLWLLRSLENGAPTNRMDWPSSARPNAVIEVDHPAPLPPVAPLEAEMTPPHPAVHIGGLPEPAFPPDLSALAALWRRKREAYPGWIVLPVRNRHKLRRTTEPWVRTVVRGIGELDVFSRLSLLREFIWRLDRLGMPLEIEWASNMEAALSDSPPAELGLSAGDATYLRECWVEVAFALARRGRQDADDAFQRWSARLDRVRTERSDWDARWHYEWCLYHLYRGELIQAEKCLGSWPIAVADPFWDTKRAGLFAELGDGDSARAIASGALDQIRRQLRTGEDIALLSREGWTMLVVEMIWEFSQSGGSGRGRRDQLAAYRSDAWSELESLRRAVSNARLRPSGSQTHRADPLTGATRTTYRLFGSVSEEIGTGFALLILCEDAGVPFRAGEVSSYLDDALRAARLIATSSPPWADSIVVRSANAKEAGEWFDRVRVASMKQTEVDELVEISWTSLVWAVESLQEATVNADLARRAIELRATLLIHFSSRIPAEQNLRLTSQVIDWFRSGAGSRAWWLVRPLGRLLRELLRFAAPTDFAVHLPSLLSLPIPGVDGVAAGPATEWPEPLDDAPLPNGLVARGDSNELLRAVDRLIALLVDPALVGTEARDRVITRLSSLHVAGLLTPNEQSRLGEALWAQIDPASQLPDRFSSYPHLLLTFPEPEPDRASRAVREFLVSQDLVVAVTRDPSTGRQVAAGFTDQPERLLRAWFYATCTDDPGDWRTAIIEWSQDEALALLDRIEAWWADERIGLADPEADDMIRDRVVASVKWVPRVLARVVRQHVAPGTREAERMLNLLQEMRRARIAPAQALVASVPLDPEIAVAAAEMVRSGFQGDDDEAAGDAAEALVRWEEAAERGAIAGPPPDLRLGLIGRIAMPGSAGLRNILTWAAHYVKFRAQPLDPREMILLGDALAVLESSLRLPGPGEMPALEKDDPQTAQLRMRLRSRIAAAELAAEVGRAVARWQASNPEIPELKELLYGVERWRVDAHDDVLPEVRRAFLPHA